MSDGVRHNIKSQRVAVEPFRTLEVVTIVAALVESLLNDVGLSLDMRYVTRYG